MLKILRVKYRIWYLKRRLKRRFTTRTVTPISGPQLDAMGEVYGIGRVNNEPDYIYRKRLFDFLVKG